MSDLPNDAKLPPPSGDTQRAEGYINQLVPLISQSKLRVTHTDLSKFDPSSLHDHYSLDLKDYQIEISHTKQPTTGRDSYVILFNNIKALEEGQTQKEILAYLIISEEQFKKIKDVSDEQIETLKRIEEEKRFQEAITPIDELFNKIAKGEVDLSQQAQPVPNLPPEGKKDGPAVVDSTLPNSPDNAGIEERPEQPKVQAEEPIAPETPFIEEKPPEPISALAAAASIPLVEEVPTPPVETTAPSPLTSPQSQTPSPAETPSLSETAPSNPQYNQPLSAPNTTIEEVQKALKQAYEQSPQAPLPPEYRPNLGQVAPTATPPALSFSPTNNSISAENNLPSNPQIDQAIDQAFKPADNSVLAQVVKTPEV